MEKSINKVELEGFVGISPEHISFNNGNSILKFSLATNESYKDRNGNWQNQTTWHRIVMMNGIAQKAASEINRGNRLNIVGKIVNRAFTNKKGEKVSLFEIMALQYNVIPKKVENDNK